MGVGFPFTLMRKGSKGSRYQTCESLPHTWLPTTESFLCSLWRVGGVFVWFWFSVRQRASREQCVLKKQEFQPAKKNRSHPAWSPEGIPTSSGEPDFDVAPQRGQRNGSPVTGALFRRRREGMVNQNAGSVV